MAASGVNVKMGVDGLSKFKQDLNQAKSAVKTLDTEIALAEKQFKASGDAESYMAEKGELLKAKLEKQSQIVNSCQKALDEMTKNGVDRASKSYQDMYQTMINAKGAMIDTQQAMDNIAGAAEDADTAVTGMDSGLKQIGQGISYQNVTSALGSITSGLETILTKAWEVGKAITRDVLGAGSWADDLNTRAAYFGLEADDLQRMEKTASLIDTSVDAIISAKKRMKRAIGAGGESTTDALEALGLGTVVDTDPEEMFWKIGEAIMNLGDEYEREEAAQKLFGRSWSELIPLFETGREEYEKLNASWNVVPKEQIDALQQMDDQYQILKNDLETVKLTFLGELAPAAEGVMKTLTGLVEKFLEYINSEKGQQMMESLGNAVESLFEDLTKIDPEQTLKDIVGIFDGIRDGLEWIKNNKDTVVTAIKAVVGAWVGLKAASSVATMMQLFNGLKGFFGGGGNGGVTGGGEAAAAASGGWITGVKNALTGASTKAAGVISSSGMLPGVLMDMFMNQTNAGRELRDGGNFWAGLTQDFSEKKAEIEKNAETFEDDWNDFYLNNPIMKLFRGEYDNPYQPESLEDADWRPSYMRDQTPVLSHPAVESEQSRPDLSSSSVNGMTYEEFKKLPKELQAAIAESMSNVSVYLDGQKVGEMVSPYVSDELAGYVLND